MAKPKHTPQDLEHYTVYPDGVIVSHKGWRGNKSKAIRPYMHNQYLAVNLTIHGQRKRWHVVAFPVSRRRLSHRSFVMLP